MHPSNSIFHFSRSRSYKNNWVILIIHRDAHMIKVIEVILKIHCTAQTSTHGNFAAFYCVLFRKLRETFAYIHTKRVHCNRDEESCQPPFLSLVVGIPSNHFQNGYFYRLRFALPFHHHSISS